MDKLRELALKRAERENLLKMKDQLIKKEEKLRKTEAKKEAKKEDQE